jgi:hypothetical protein
MRRRAAILGCCTASLALTPADAGAARRASIKEAPASQAIAELNAQRAANGIPAAIVENLTWSADCAAHDHYMAITDTLINSETPGQIGYTTGGAFAAANSVLIGGASWSSGDPYDDAPLHLDQLLAPRLQAVGSADVDGYSCTTTFPGWTGPGPAAPTVYTYPGNGASAPAGEVASERPFTPGALVGITEGTRTGPYLIVLADAPGQSPFDNPATLSGATLTGPGGPVAIATVDGETPVPSPPNSTLDPLISPGGFIIPLVTLVPGATYQAHVLVSFAGAQTPYSWSFLATAVPPDSRLRFRARRLGFRSASPAPIHVTFTRRSGRHAPAITLRPGHRTHLSLAIGDWRVCGRQPAVQGFGAYRRCLALIVTRGRVRARRRAARSAAPPSQVEHRSRLHS